MPAMIATRDFTPMAINKQCQTDIGEKEIPLQCDSQNMNSCAASYVEGRCTTDEWTCKSSCQGIATTTARNTSSFSQRCLRKLIMRWGTPQATLAKGGNAPTNLCWVYCSTSQGWSARYIWTIPKLYLNYILTPYLNPIYIGFLISGVKIC